MPPLTNLPLAKLSKIVLLLAIPLALFLVARERASWRPHLVTRLPTELIAFSPDGRFFACGPGDSTGLVYVGDLSTGEEIQRKAFLHPITQLAFSTDSQTVAVAWLNPLRPNQTNKQSAAVGVWNLTGTYHDLEATKVSPPDRGEIFTSEYPQQLRFSPDDQTLWLASSNSIRSWHLPSGRLTWQWHHNQAQQLAFAALSSNCRFCFYADGDLYTVMDLQSHKRLIQTKLPTYSFGPLEFSADGTLALYPAYGSSTACYNVMDTRTGQVLWQSSNYPYFTGDKVVTAAARPTQLEVHNARTGTLLYRLPALAGTEPLTSNSPTWLYSGSGHVKTVPPRRSHGLISPNFPVQGFIRQRLR